MRPGAHANAEDGPKGERHGWRDSSNDEDGSGVKQHRSFDAHLQHSRMVAKGGIEPPTRGFSAVPWPPTIPFSISHLRRLPLSGCAFHVRSMIGSCAVTGARAAR